jgi:hypothetical protein
MIERHGVNAQGEEGEFHRGEFLLHSLQVGVFGNQVSH